MNSLIQRYRSVPFSKRLKKLFLSSLIRHVGQSLLGSFSIIFFFEYFGESILKVLVFQLILFFIFLVLTPLVTRYFKTVGLEPLMRFSIPFLSVAMLALYLLEQRDISAMLGLYVAGITVYRILYWPPFHIDLAKTTDDQARGKQIAIMSSILIIVSALAPIISGYIISVYGFSPLFILSMITVLGSIVPLSSLKTTYEEYSFGYLETFKKVFQKSNRPSFLAHFSRGLQFGVSGIIWPIYIFLLFDGRYLTVGIIGSLAVISLIIIRAIVGYFDDKGKKEFLLKYSGMVGASSWVVRMFVDTPVEVFAADTYYNTGEASQTIAYTHTMYEHAHKNGSYIDEYTILRETALNIGRVTFYLLAIPIVLFFPIKITFIVAALASLTVSYASRERNVS